MKRKFAEQIKRRSLILFIAVAGLGFFNSCGGGDAAEALGCGTGSWTSEVAQELQDMSDALQIYMQDPTTQNCEQYKQAAKKYIDALKSAKRCVPKSELAEYERSLREAREEINSIDCTQ